MSSARTIRKALESFAPAVVLWLVLVSWLAILLVRQAGGSERLDAANVREWLDEVRTFRKTLPEQIREYAAAPPTRAAEKRSELFEQMRAMAEPTRAYLNQLPSFPVIYRLEVVVPTAAPVVWESPLPRPRQQNPGRVRTLEYAPLNPNEPTAVVRCDYQMHAFNKQQSLDAERRRVNLVAGSVLAAAALLAAVFVTRAVRRDRRRELARVTAQAAADHAARELLEAQVRQDELDRALLEQRLAAADLRTRADTAEKATLEMRSQLYASIGIMAGSYAHNIKNLLVRPNDLLSRCLETATLPRDQAHMLTEVRGTLSTVTERLQQILRTVRRDPARTEELTTVDVAALATDTARTWADMAREKWKLTLQADTPAKPLFVRGDFSHLQQALENLVFNARDATFEMRNHFRELARTAAASDRKERLIEAAGWRGIVTLRTQLGPSGEAILEVTDNGVGMTPEVRAQCLTTHFSTKRDNALYEGYNAGTGLGLSFVAMVLDHHGATLDIESQPGHGTTFRVIFPRPLSASASMVASGEPVS